MDFTKLPWNWVEMCGPGGLVPWYPSKHDIGACFQQIFLQVPVQFLFAIVSAYYYGMRPNRNSSTCRLKWTILARVLCSLAIAFIPLIKAFVGLTYVNGMFRPVDYLTSGVEVLAWSIHTGYVHSLRYRSNVHGPILVRVLWTLTAVLSIINLRSLTMNNSDFASSISFGFGVAVVVFQVFYGMTFITVCLNANTTENIDNQFNERTSLLGSYFSSFREEYDHGYLGVAWENTSFLSRLVFYWVHPLLKKGGESKLLTCDDLYDLPNELNTSNLSIKLYTTINNSSSATPLQTPEVSFGPRISLVRALHKCFGVEFYAIGLLKLTSDILNFAGPILLKFLVDFIERKEEDTSLGYYYAAGLFVTTLFSAFLNTHFSFLMSQVGLKLRGSLISLIYRKTLNISYSSVNSFTVGEIVNFMSTDTDRIVNACPSFHTFWSIPLQLAVSFYLLYNEVGISFAAGVAFAIVLIPINKYIANKIGSLSTEMMEAKDKRVSAMSEILRGMKVLKLHVWEEYFLNKVFVIRRRELKYLKSRKYLDALCVYFWSSTPVLVSILTLGTYYLLGNHLTASTVFTTVALLNMLIAPLNAFPWVLNGLVEAWVSVKRIQRLLDAQDLDLRDYYSPNSKLISVSNCSVEWDPSQLDEDDSTAPVGLQNVDFSIERGQLVGVIGSVGSGKSTLIHALLGELTKTMGEVSIQNWEGGFGLLTQTPWIQHGTLRENILFGKVYDSGKYKAVIDACCLTEDLSAFHGGDMARVGEGGTTLSGGQRARLALARAVYQDKDIYLLDDILSALDPPVARHVYHKVICGLLQSKTRILCTNNTQFLTNADLVIHLDRGRVLRYGAPSEVLPNYTEFVCSDNESVASYKESRDETEPEVNADEEVNETGAVRSSIYMRYLMAVGPFLVMSIVLSLILMQVSRNATDFWLSVWVSASNNTISESPPHYYLIIYLVLAILNSFFTLFRAFLFAYGGICAAQIIHDKLINKIMCSKITFFDISPVGRILNRFSSDTYTVDDSLPFITNILFAVSFGLIGSLAITIYGLPWLCLLVAPLVPMYHYLQSTYRPCSRDIKRLSSTALSPLYSHFNETLSGLVTIRAFKSLSRFHQRNEEYLENSQRALFAGYAVSTWLAFRLQIMGVAIVTGVAFIAVIQHEFDVVAPALVGLTVAYALSVTSLLSGVVTAFTETEREFVALERVSQYIDEIETEESTGEIPPYAWPSQGVIRFQAVYLKYREHLTPSLNGVSFETRPAEKIGVVGRTGAGKTSIITALLRLVPAFSGNITIDAVNISQIHLQGLRSRLAVIPQDPYLFEGSLRSNLDPLSEFRDPELWGALKKCQLSQVIEALGGLHTLVDVNGRNFSQGQRQLLCLARAVLKNAKIVCIDEGTASVDEETDRQIQMTIRSCFRQSTVLTIAHRISTVMDSDRLLVLRDGEVVEFDTPDNLASDSTSYFYKLSQRHQS